MQSLKNETELLSCAEKGTCNNEGAQDIVQAHPESETAHALEKNLHLYPPVDALHQQLQLHQRMRRKYWMISGMVYVGLLLWTFFWASEHLRLLPLWLVALVQAVVLFLIVLSFWINSVAHEVGHMLAGMACGMKLLLLSVGRWRFERTVKGFRWRKATPVPGILGVAAMTVNAVRYERLSRMQRGFYYLGGPGINLILGGVALALAYLTQMNPFLKVMLLILGWPGLLSGVMNLLPLKNQHGWRTDGRQIIDALTGKDDALVNDMCYLNGLLLAGRRPRDWPLERIPVEATASDLSRPFHVRMDAELVRLEYALDSDDREQAQVTAAWLSAHFHQMPDGIRQMVALALARYAANMLHDAALADAWRAWCEGGLVNQAAQCHTLDVWLALARGDGRSARVKLARAQAALDGVMMECEHQMLVQQLVAFEQKIQKEYPEPLGNG